MIREPNALDALASIAEDIALYTSYAILGDDMSTLTEDEAKTKICPLSFSVAEIRGHDGCGIREGGPWKCIASACMAWRVGAPAQDATFQKVEMREGESPIGDGWAIAESGTDGPYGKEAYSWNIWLREKAPERLATGFCGAFGKPER